MAPPSFARATLSSKLKTSPSISKVGDQSTTQTTPRKLKRPSTLSVEDRRSILYNADLYHILKKDPTKPCLLSGIPSEIRTTIYAYVLEEDRQHPQIKYQARRDQPLAYIWPSILHVCRAMRIEAAYTYYACTPFIFNVENLEFSVVRQWVEMLPVPHRALLSKNNYLTVNVNTIMREIYAYPQNDWFFDAKIEDHWKACQKFGNIYHIRNDHNRRKFILFCRLATWWLWCAQPVRQNIEWKYIFRDKSHAWGYFLREETSRYALEEFLKRYVVCFALPCVVKNWTGRSREKDMAPHALSFLVALENAFERLFAKKGSNPSEIADLRKTMQSLRKVLAKWECGDRRGPNR